MGIQLYSDAFEFGKPIPADFTADGRNISPPLKWAGLPESTRELALIVEDPDAPTTEPFVHWVIYKIPAVCPGLHPAIGNVPHPKAPLGALQGRNSFRHIGYDGPAPPPGHGVHHYHFRLFALSCPLEVQSGLDAKSLEAAMASDILGEGQLVGTYER